VPSEHFRQGLELLADVALRPVFPDAEVTRERDVLLADLAQLRDDMHRYPLRLLLSAAFGDHPYGFGPEVMEAAMAAVTADDLRRWHATELAEPWTFVVGDVDPDRVREAVAEVMGTPSRSLDRREPRPTWPDAPQVRSVTRDRAQTALAVAFPGPSRTEDDRVALEVLANAVSGLGNRLFEELRSRRSLAYTVSAYPMVRRHAGAFIGYIATSPARSEEARNAMIEELLRLRDDPPSEDEIERARRYTVGSWQIRTQTNSAQLWDLADALMLGGGLAELRDYEDRVRAVTRSQVGAAARRWFDPDRIVEGAVHGRD
jgi:zinc protease